MPRQKLTATFNEITVKRGEAFDIELKATPSAGYEWSIMAKSGPVTKLRDTFVENSKDDSLIGSPQMHVMTFRAEEEGVIKIELCYARPWESVMRDMKKFKINVEK